MTKYSENYIATRLSEIEKNTGGRITKIIANIAYEFGVDRKKYSKNMTQQEIIDITHQNQDSIKGLEKDIQEEIEYILSLSAA